MGFEYTHTTTPPQGKTPFSLYMIEIERCLRGLSYNSRAWDSPQHPFSEEKRRTSSDAYAQDLKTTINGLREDLKKGLVDLDR